MVACEDVIKDLWLPVIDLIIRTIPLIMYEIRKKVSCYTVGIMDCWFWIEHNSRITITVNYIEN